jgi:hypothetical protein
MTLRETDTPLVGTGKSSMRPPQVDYGWNPIETAPLDEDIALQVTDGRGGPYTLQ